MEGAKPGTKPIRPAGPAAVPATPTPAAPGAAAPSPATPVQGRVARSFESVSALRPAPLARAGFGATVGASTVFGARMQQFNLKNNPTQPSDAPGTASFQSMGRLRARNADLQESALGEKGLRPEAVADVLEFMEAVARSGRHFEDEGQRSAMAQVLGFWSRQVAPLVERPVGIELSDYAG